MKGFFRSNAFKLLLMLTVILAAVLILSVTTGNTTVSGFFQAIISPMEDAGTELTAQVRENLGLDSMSRQELEALCAQLSDENNTLRDQLVDYYDLKQKNEQYAQALDIVQESPDIKLAAATVTTKDPSDVFFGFSIDVGSLDGIQVNDPVISSDGIVGVVTEVYSSSSRVTTIFSEDINVGATSEEFSENGVVTSDAASANSGIVNMTYLSKDTKITKDTIITTSGAGGIFPKGLIIGKVSYLSASDKDVSVSAVIVPSADIQDISEVFVVTDFAGKGDEKPVDLTSQPSADDGEDSN
jgi:rod shape-determining protein MreC